MPASPPFSMTEWEAIPPGKIEIFRQANPGQSVTGSVDSRGSAILNKDWPKEESC
jgi:hypothetical protein